MMQWNLEGNRLISECRKYQITNEGKRGDDRYCLWTTKKDHPGFCLMLRMGTFSHCKVGL